ncbi:hypothetical protein PVK06_011141 [Gossypium arboreum]|uniref:Uncharacterized protein n=1 Tax=Gossypium arboreum TaxID=29729 RepID=A0ABR0Q878_GOSAR|nr:hypothetical protein PVK06_011141 [Gossypium arboreum]
MAVDSSPASRVSWKDKLLGGSVSNSLDGDANIDLKFVEGDICRSNLNGLSGFLYQKKILEEISSLVGEVVKLDIKTDNKERGQFTRMAIFVDLEKPLTSQVLVNGRLQQVEFEPLLEVCFLYGEGDPTGSLRTETAPARTGVALSAVGDAFGPWMMVEHKSRCK